MKIIKLLFIICTAITVLSCSTDEIDPNALDSIDSPQLRVYKAPEGAPVNTKYSVFVRFAGGQWVQLHEYDSGVEDGNLSAPIFHMAFVSFDSDFSKKIEVRVKKNSGSFGTIKVRPDIARITPKILDASTISFTMDKPQKISVEEDGYLHNNLMIYANALESKTYTEGNDHIHYYGPGIHLLGENGQGTLYVGSNDTIYLAGGAIVYGKIEVTNSSNVAILGRGILCGEKFTDHAYPHAVGENLIKFENCSNVLIDGITLLNTVSWNVRLTFCNNVKCKDLKIMGWTINSDGIDPISSSNVLIQDCFIRNYDDCISIKGSYAPAANSLASDYHDVTIQDCVLWTDQGRAIAIGPESYSAKNKIFENIIIKNVDILYNKNYDVDWAKGALSIILGDEATMRNVKFEDIRVDKLGAKSNLVAISIFQSPYNSSPGKYLENVTFNNVTLNSPLPINNTIKGLDQSRIIKGVYFNNLKINGIYADKASTGSFEINSFVQDVTFNVSN